MFLFRRARIGPRQPSNSVFIEVYLIGSLVQLRALPRKPTYNFQDAGSTKHKQDKTVGPSLCLHV